MALITIPETFSIECPPSLVPGARVTLCGESPGRQEVAWRVCPQCNAGFDRPGKCVTCGVPLVHKPQGFVGGSGRILERMLKHAGLTFAHCNRTNVCKRRPPGDDFGIFYLDPKQREQPTKELEWWKQLLYAEITRYRPHLLIAVGGEALKAFCPSAIGITKWQGSLLESPVIPGLKVLPIVHPAYIMRDNWEYYYITQTYLKRAAVESTSPRIVQEEPRNEFITKPLHAQALDWLAHIQLSNVPWYIDIETRGDTIMCFGLFSSARPGAAICIPIQTTTGPYWSVVDEAAIWRALSLAMRDNKFLRNQNVVYDLDYLLDYGCEPSAIDFDPMIGMNVLWPEFPKGLDFTTSIFTRYPYYKDEGKTWGKKVPDQQVWTYNCKDMVATPETTEGIIKELVEVKRFDLCQKRSTAFIPIVMEMMRNKLRLDRAWHSKLAGILADERIKKHQELTATIGRDINVKSSQQIQTLLYDELRLPVKYKHGTRIPTVDEYALKELRAETSHPILAMILEERHLRTKESNSINVTFDSDPDGELYLGYMGNIGGTKTARWSYNKSPKWRGASPQTIPKIMRLMYAPPHGSVFWQRDLSQAEARIVAWLSNCRFLLDVFDSPIKIHKLVGSRIFKKPAEMIVADSLEYDISKRVVHGYDYMMQSRKIAILANVPYDFADAAYKEYAKEVHEIPEWHNEVKQTVLKTGRLVTPMGRVRECFQGTGAIANLGQLPDNTWRDLISYVPQSTVPDVLNEGMLEVWQKLPWIRWHQQGHDSYLCSGDPARTQEVYEVAEKAADVHFEIRGRSCHIPGEFQWGYLWGAMLGYKPGEDTSREAWAARCEAEGIFNETKITEKLYSLF